ncbi:N-acyl-D-glucosamine 2-epimerase [Fibrella aestuarina]|uniref:N-acyl-D-glucosamine 2-epimerase n=1 Tax=Fibrivirga algicola TaxID=2950420 RepID=A0ABX0Q9W2_9BACT|nr:N-acyl-D-glucosamine 2-epimerase [Fibrivirga algicola]
MLNFVFQGYTTTCSPCHRHCLTVLFSLVDFHKIATHCQTALIDQCLPFWLTNACDGLGGGYFDYLTPDGKSIDANKTVARQAEQVWAFAYLYTNIDAQPDWLDHALHGADFLAEHAHNSQMGCYTYLDRLGNPAATPATAQLLVYDPLTGARVAAAYAQIHQATGDDQWAMLAKQTFQATLRHYQTTREALLNTSPDHLQPLRHLSQPVALLRALVDARSLFATTDWKEATEPLLDEILTEFLDKRHDTLREYVGMGGAFSNTPEGRRIATGLTMDAASLLIDVGTLLGNRRLTLQATNWSLRTCEWAWPSRAEGRTEARTDDRQGLVRWLDWKDQPVAFEGDTQRLAADHLLALAALTNGYWHTRHPEAPRWIKRIYEYTFQHFPDTRPATSWHWGITSQQQPVSPFKATADTGCYALVRGLATTWQHLDQCALLQPVGLRGVGV